MQVKGADPTPHSVVRDGSEPRCERSRSDLYGSYTDSESFTSSVVSPIEPDGSPARDLTDLMGGMTGKHPPVRESVSVGTQVDFPAPVKCVTMEVAVQAAPVVACKATSPPDRVPSGKRSRRMRERKF